MSALGWAVPLVLRSFRMQLVGERLPNFLLSVALSPLVSIIYILMARGAGREDLTSFVVFAPMLTGMWGSAMTSSGAAIGLERGLGTLELLVASPAPAALAILGRISAVTVFALFAVPETLVVAWLLGVQLTIVDPVAFILALLGLTFATIGIGLAMASAFVLSRSASLFQNLLGFPFFILAGTAFPIALLPAGIQPLSALVSMSWAGDLLRRSTASVPVELVARDVGALLVLGTSYLALGLFLFRVVERRIRYNGTISNE